MRLSLFQTPYVPVPALVILLTILFIETPRSDAQPPIPSPTSSQSTSDSSGWRWLGYLIAAIVGLLLLFGCFHVCFDSTTSRRSQVWDVEQQPAAASESAQEAEPSAPPLHAPSKEEVVVIGTTNETEPQPDELRPPPYYPVGYFLLREKKENAHDPPPAWLTALHILGGLKPLPACPKPAFRRATTTPA